MRSIDNSFGVCRSCGKQIIWIRMKSGKNMPCNTVVVDYCKSDSGKDKIVTPFGEVVSGTVMPSPNGADGFGYISHFATCTKNRK